jgi:tRNA C32,U32 (ribose-2'-O)-methylase TrmJ
LASSKYFDEAVLKFGCKFFIQEGSRMAEQGGKSMASAHEEDVVMAFRQAVEEEMTKLQQGQPQHPDVFEAGISAEESLRRLLERHQELEHEVALLRTIVLRLVSEPVDSV